MKWHLEELRSIETAANATLSTQAVLTLNIAEVAEKAGVAQKKANDIEVVLKTFDD